MLLSTISLFFVQSLTDLRAKSDPDSQKCKPAQTRFFISQAFRFQVAATQAGYYREKDKANDLHTKSVRSFEEYIGCTPKEGVSENTRLGLATSYLELGEFAKAEDQVKTSLRTNPNHRESIFFLSKLQIRSGRLQEAVQLLESKISHFPDDSDFLFLLGSLNRELKNSKKSILYFTSLQDSIQRREGNPKYKIHALKNLADLYYQAREPKKALAYYQSYLILNPADTDARFQVAQIFSQLGDFGASKNVLLEIYRSNPSNQEVELLLAEMYFVESRSLAYPVFQKLKSESKIPKGHLTETLHKVLNRDWRNAEPKLRGYIQKHENRISARLAFLDVLKAKKPQEELFTELKNVATVAYSMKQFLTAYNLTGELISYQLQFEAPRGDLGYSYWFMANCMDEMGFPNRAVLFNKEAIRYADSDEDLQKYRLHLGHLLLGEKVKRSDEALKIAQDLLEKNPDLGPAKYLKAYSYFQKGNYSQSLGFANEALELEPENSGYLFFRAIVHEKQNNWELTESDLRESIRLNPNNPVTYNYLGFMLAEKEIKKEESLSLIQKAVDLEPDNAAFQDSLGWIYFKLGDYENAIFHLQLAKQLQQDRGSEDPTILDHLGDVYYASEDWVNAEDYWRRAVQVSKDKEEIQRIQKKIKEKKLSFSSRAE